MWREAPARGCHRRYHRVLGHGLPVTLLGPLALALFGLWLLPGVALLPLWLWLQLALLAHLITDFCFYRWPVQLLWPFSSWGVGQGLISWNDLVPTLEAAFKDTGVHLVTVPIDYAENTRVLVEELQGRVPELA